MSPINARHGRPTVDHEHLPVPSVLESNCFTSALSLAQRTVTTVPVNSARPPNWRNWVWQDANASSCSSYRSAVLIIVNSFVLVLVGPGMWGFCVRPLSGGTHAGIIIGYRGRG